MEASNIDRLSAYDLYILDGKFIDHVILIKDFPAIATALADNTILQNFNVFLFFF